MLSHAVVRRRTGTFTTGPNGLEVPEWIVVYTGKCSIKAGGGKSSSGTSSTTERTASLDISRSSMVAKFPHDTELLDGDLIDVNGGESAGLVFRVVEADQGDHRTACRVPVIQAARPVEWAA